MRGGAPARIVTLSRRYDTTLENLWDAATSPSRIPRWFMPVSGELELGGRYQLEGNAGGVVETCAPMARFAATWEFAGDVSWIEASFSDDAPGARLTLSHIALLSPHWDEYGPGAAGVGWDTGFLGLALHIDAPDRPKVDQEAFVMSPRARRSSRVPAMRGQRRQSRMVRIPTPRARPPGGRRLSTRASPPQPDANPPCA